MSVLTPDHFRSAQFPPLSESWPRRCELFPQTSSHGPMISSTPMKSTWCENYHKFALTQVVGHAVEEHSPGTLLAEQAPGALTADPNLQRWLPPDTDSFLIHCIFCEQRCQQSSASVALCDPAGALDGSPGVGPGLSGLALPSIIQPPLLSREPCCRRHLPC